MSDKPLEGIRVLTLEQFGAGPYGTMFLAELDTRTGNATYVTMLGYSRPTGLAMDPKGAAYILGSTSDPSFPVTPGALQMELGGKDVCIVCRCLV